MKRTLIALALLAIILTACASQAASEEPYMLSEPYTEESRAYEVEAPAPAMDVAGQSYSEGGEYNASLPSSQERLVIMNANLTIVVADPETKMNDIAALAEGMGGFVVSSNLYQTYTNSGSTAPEAYITVRVPAGQLDTALTQIKADVVEVQNENRSGQDVTQEYVDLSSRLKAYEDALEQLEAIMETNTTPEEVLNVFNQMMYYREQIEIIKGQMQYYEQASALSAISVTIIAEETIQPLEIGGWKPEGVVRDAVQTLIDFLQGFVDFLIWLVIFILPMLLVIFGPLALVIWAIIAGVKRRKAKKAQKAASQ
ncbi:MAG: DUF4349 domain-containing protein [Chloroflexi bacterium]|nr:DUF4349 domain-containing protein [Chloroflexota bacterium]